MNSSQAEIDDLLIRTAPDAPTDRTLLFAMRRMAMGGLNDAHAAHALFSAFGGSHRRPLVLLRALMAELARSSRNRIMVAPCCCGRMTHGEAMLMGAIGIAAEDPRRAHSRLAMVLGTSDCLGALSSAQALGQTFEDLGRPLSPAAL
jgi:hypothetical protein